MTQTLALIVDAYREMHAKRLFWVTLILSGVFIGAFALIGYNASGLTLAGYQFEFPLAERLYKPIFDQLVIGFWLTWAAMILALISTAGIFPDLLSGGSIDLYLSRPISRWRLFLTKYFCGLMFVALQVTVVSGGSFLVMGVRGHQWLPSLFLAIPLVVLLFSYVFSICVLLGVWTRSTVTALLLAVLAWSFCSVIQQAEEGLLAWQRVMERRVEDSQQTIRECNAQLAQIAAHPDSDLFGAQGLIARLRIRRAENLLPSQEHDTKLPSLLHRIAYGLRVAVPKTRETTDLFDRWLYTDTEVAQLGEIRARRFEERGHKERQERAEADIEVQQLKRTRSARWIIGTSLADEILLVGVAGWLFCRRDY